MEVDLKWASTMCTTSTKLTVISTEGLVPGPDVEASTSLGLQNPKPPGVFSGTGIPGAPH